MNRKNTENYCVTDGCRYCSYCHTDIFPLDIMDKYGGYCGSYYQCDCEQAKIEYQMNEEIQILENQIEEIRNKYWNRLKIDQDKINQTQYEKELQRLKERYGIDQPEEEE